MLSKVLSRLIACVLMFACVASSLVAAHVWNFLGAVRIDGTRDHERIEVTRHDGRVQAIHLRVGGEAIYFDRLIVHFLNGRSEEFSVRERISPEGRNYVIELPGEGHVLESVELWYFKEPWGHNPSVSLYGAAVPE